MSEPTPAPVVESRLWRFVQLVNHSRHFPVLVAGAASQRGLPFTDAVLFHVAANPTVLENITMPLDGSVDEILEHLILTAGQAVDTVIFAALDSFDAETSEANGWVRPGSGARNFLGAVLGQ